MRLNVEIALTSSSVEAARLRKQSQIQQPSKTIPNSRASKSAVAGSLKIPPKNSCELIRLKRSPEARVKSSTEPRANILLLFSKYDGIQRTPAIARRNSPTTAVAAVTTQVVTTTRHRRRSKK